ncbi:MAG: putative ABC transporter permease [Candidatus Saccharibacteria bacterium]|nr:putative ABC transporter permease [Candidatus Saccharibacteria bacterium]
MVKVEAEKPAKFAEGLGYQKLSVIFIIACIFGDVYEIILNFCFHFFGNNGEIFLERRSAVIYGPFSVIYGVGAVILAKFLAERGLKWWQIFIRGALICGIAEIVLGYLQIFFTGTSSWDYSSHWLSFANGLSSPLIIFLWGFVALIFIKFIYPLICKLTDKIPAKIGSKVLNIVMILLVIDMLISFSAVVRWNYRHEGKQPFTPYGQFLDSVYPDDFMKKAYPNMEFIKK